MSRDVSFEDFSGSAAQNYERYFVPAVAAPVAPGLLEAADLRAGERVLDLACGTGLVARLAAEGVGEGGHVIGVDVAPDMLDVARSVPSASGAAIEWRQGDAASLPLPDDAVDVVVCQMALMLFGSPVAALAEARRVLAPAGRLALSTPGRIQPPFEAMADALAGHVDPRAGGFLRAVFSMDDPIALERLLGEAGFRDVQVRTTTVPLRLPAPREFLWQYVSATPLAMVVGGAPEGARTALGDEVADRWEPFVEGGSTVVRQPMLIATARAGSSPGA